MTEVSIVGRSDGYADVYNAEGAVWAVSSVFKQLDPTRVDMIYNIHPPEAWEPWLIEEKHRVIVPDAFPGPYRKLNCTGLLKKYGPVFGSSIAWIMAFAIEQRVKKINIFGIDMATQSEYVNQRDTFFYWCGRAEALGIEVFIPTDRRVFFKDRIYGVMK